jgi:hypothetical protein
MLGAALRRQYERSTVSVSMALAFSMLGLATLAFFYPTGFSLGLAFLLSWLGLGALLRAITELFQRRARKRRRRRTSAHGGGAGASSSGGSRTITGFV